MNRAVQKLTTVLTGAFLMAGATTARADTQTMTLIQGFNFVTSQVAGAPDNQIGNPGFLSGFQGALTYTTSDTLTYFDCTLGGETELWYKTGPGAGWRFASDNTPASWQWNPGVGVIVRHRSSVPRVLTLTGTPLVAPVAKTLSPGCLYLLGSQVLGVDTFENITGHPASDFAAVDVYRRAPAGGTDTLPGDPPGTGGWNLYSARAGVWSPPFPALNAGESVHVFVPRTLHWTGAVNGTWDIGTTANWSIDGVATTYSDGDSVIFDDSATGPTDVSIAVGGVTPASVSVNNNTLAYSFVGPHGIGCCSNLEKNGTGSLSLLNENANGGAFLVNAGTLFVDGSLAAMPLGKES